jgi:hypothetical protein
MPTTNSGTGSCCRQPVSAAERLLHATCTAVAADYKVSVHCPALLLAHRLNHAVDAAADVAAADNPIASQAKQLLVPALPCC